MTTSDQDPGQASDAGAEHEVPRERAQFRQLLATNPNYFGTLADIAGDAIDELPFEVVLPKQGDPRYEELTCVGYEPRRAQLEATFSQKLGSGYKGGPCPPGSREYVRFYVDDGAGWTDAGLAGTGVTDLEVKRDCAKKSTHPLDHTVAVTYSPRKRPCTTPRFVRVRAILSWEVAPPAGQPFWQPVWGSVLECTIQIAPSRRFSLSDLVAKADLIEKIKLPVELQDLFEVPIDLPDPPPEPLAIQAKRYARAQVEPHRFAMAAALAATSLEPVPGGEPGQGPTLPSNLLTTLTEFKAIDLDLPQILGTLEDTSGNTSYEELECVGLDNNREQLVGTFRIKRPSGFSGPLCSSGSTEYVAFWADWDDTCEWTFVGTAKVAAHDFEKIDEKGLCYSAVLPVDLDELRRNCKRPRVGRIRAVLSWNNPPSTTDPNELPYWGNRIDTHVRVNPGTPGDPTQPGTWITLIGGVNVGGIDPVTGLTTGSALFADLGVPAGAGRPFGGWIVVRGPSLPGYQYRLRKRESGGVWSPMTDAFQTTNSDGTAAPVVTPAADGTVSYLPSSSNFTNLLGRLLPSGDEIWEIQLEVLTLGSTIIHRIQLDNTAPDISLAITSPGGTCGKFPVGTLIQGSFAVSDTHLSSWSLSVPDPDPTDPFGVNAVSPSSGTVTVPSAGQPGTWSLPTAGTRACGYNMVLNAWDRTIRNSGSSAGNHSQTVAGFCLE